MVAICFVLYICGTKAKIMNTTTQEKKSVTRLQAAADMAILDAIEKGHTDSKELTLYVKSETFKESVLNYYKMLSEFGAKVI